MEISRRLASDRRRRFPCRRFPRPWPLAGRLITRVTFPGPSGFSGKSLRLTRPPPRSGTCSARSFKSKVNLAKPSLTISKLFACEPDFAEVLNNLAVALQSQGKVDEATACLRRAVQLKPDYADAHSNLGNALQFDGKLNEAEACYRYALALKTDNPDTHHNLGNLLRATGLPGRGDDVL